MDDNEETTIFNSDDSCLPDVAEDNESDVSETATEEEVCEFHRSTECKIPFSRMSCPASSITSCQRVQNPNSSDIARGDADTDDADVSMCVFSREALNKRSSEDSDNIPSNIEEGNDDSSKKDFMKTQVRQTNVGETSDVNSIEKDDVQSDVLSDSENSSKKGRSLLQRFKNFTDRFSTSTDKETKSKRFASLKNSMTLPSRSKKKMESPGCKSMENVEDKKGNTLPQTKKTGIKNNWKFLLLGKGTKNPESLDGWTSDADVNNLSLPCTSKSQSNYSLNASPKAGAGENQSLNPFDVADQMCKKPLKLNPEDRDRLTVTTNSSANIS